MPWRSARDHQVEQLERCRPQRVAFSADSRGGEFTMPNNDVLFWFAPESDWPSVVAHAFNVVPTPRYAGGAYTGFSYIPGLVQPEPGDNL